MDESQIQIIPFEQAIEGPLLACNDAQVLALEHTRDLLETYFWESDGSGTFTPVCMEFFFSRGDGGGQLMRVPLMSLLPIPSLRLDDVSIRFQAQVNECKENSLKVRMLGENVEKTSTAELHSYLNIRLRAGVSDMPMGLAQLYQLLGDHLTSVTIEE